MLPVLIQKLLLETRHVQSHPHVISLFTKYVSWVSNTPTHSFLLSHILSSLLWSSCLVIVLLHLISGLKIN